MDEERQQVKRFRRQVDRVTVTVNLARSVIQREPPKAGRHLHPLD
jgi:hypothetical protein